MMRMIMLSRDTIGLAASTSTTQSAFPELRQLHSHASAFGSKTLCNAGNFLQDDTLGKAVYDNDCHCACPYGGGIACLAARPIGGLVVGRADGVGP